MSLRRPEQLGDCRFFDASLVISYLTIRMTTEGERTLSEQGEIHGPLWTPRGWLVLELCRDDGTDVMVTKPVRADDEELSGWRICLPSEHIERLVAQEVIGADLTQGILLRQVRILPSLRADQI